MPHRLIRSSSVLEGPPPEILSMPGVLGPTTLQAFARFCAWAGSDLSSEAEERVLILANQEIHYWSDGERFTEPLGSYLGWKLTGHVRALTNSEGPFQVQRGTTVLGQTRPWRGHFGIDSRLSSARQLDVTSDPGGRMWWAHVTDD